MCLTDVGILITILSAEVARPLLSNRQAGDPGIRSAALF